MKTLASQIAENGVEIKLDHTGIYGVALNVTRDFDDRYVSLTTRALRGVEVVNECDGVNDSTDEMPASVKQVYRRLGLDCRKTYILGWTYSRRIAARVR